MIANREANQCGGPTRFGQITTVQTGGMNVLEEAQAWIHDLFSDDAEGTGSYRRIMTIMLKRKYTARKNMMCVVGLGLSVVYDSDKEVGEFVRAIDGEDISETDKMSRVKELLKGEVGTPVTLQVSEGPNSELREVDVIRKQLWIPKPKEAQQKKEN